METSGLSTLLAYPSWVSRAANFEQCGSRAAGSVQDSQAHLARAPNERYLIDLRKECDFRPNFVGAPKRARMSQPPRNCE